MDDSKHCSKCGKTKPTSEFYFSDKWGWRSWCCQCAAEVAARGRQRYVPPMRTCRRCGKSVPREKFPPGRHICVDCACSETPEQMAKRQRYREWRANNRECVRELQRARQIRIRMINEKLLLRVTGPTGRPAIKEWYTSSDLMHLSTERFGKVLDHIVKGKRFLTPTPTGGSHEEEGRTVPTVD